MEALAARLASPGRAHRQGDHAEADHQHSAAPPGKRTLIKQKGLADESDYSSVLVVVGGEA
jgi:hypothetical protein